jgi:hypothetical protein
MWTQVMPGSPAAQFERDRLAHELGAFCGLPDGATAEDCRGQQNCVFFDAERERCALLVWDVPAHVGPAGLRWFATHRGIGGGGIEGFDEALAARCGSL